MDGLKRILLIGFRATGKSTVGRLLAQALHWTFVDMDQELTRRIGMDIAGYVEKNGWGAFRKEEKRLLRELLSDGGRPPMVIATGGGAVLHQDVFSKLPQGTLVVWLKATPETIEGRMAQDANTDANRPALTDKGDALQEIRQVLSEREPLYGRFSHITLECDSMDPKEIKEKILIHAR